MTQHIPTSVKDMLCSHWDICDIAQTNLVWTGLDNQNSIIETEDASFFVQVSDTPFQPTLIDKKTRMLRWLTDQGMTEVVPAMPTRDGMLFVEDEALGVISLYPLRSPQYTYRTAAEADQRAGIQLASWVARLHRLSTEAPSFIGEPKESLQQNLKTTQDNLGIFEQIGTMLPMLPFDDETKDLLSNFVGQVPRYKQILFDDDHVYQLIQQCSAHTRLTHNDLNLTNLSFDEQGNLVTVYDFDNAGMECRVADLQFLFYYYYTPSTLLGNEHFDTVKIKESLLAYEEATGKPITEAEKRLCALLALDRSFRGLLWLFQQFSKGAPTELLLAVNQRFRPHNPDESGSPAYQTLAMLFNGIERYSDETLLLQM